MPVWALLTPSQCPTAARPPGALPFPSPLLTHSVPILLLSPLLLRHARHIPTSGSPHGLFLLFLLPSHFSVTRSLTRSLTLSLTSGGSQGPD